MKLEQQQQKVEELSGASVRALTGDKLLRFRGRRLHRDLRAFNFKAPHLITDPLIDDFQSYRGAADALSLRITFSDADIFTKHVPEEPLAAFIYDILEQLRVESLIPEEFPGIKNNVQYRFNTWCNTFYKEQHTESHVGMLLYTVYLVVWSHFNRKELDELTGDLIEGTRFNLMPLVGKAFYEMKKFREDQANYAPHAAAFAQIIFEMIDEESITQLNAESIDIDDEEMSNLAQFISFNGVDQTLDVGYGVSGDVHYFEQNDGKYDIYTTEFDKEFNPSEKVRANLLKALREQLDEQVKGQGVNFPRLKRQLAEMFSMPKRDGWNFDQEEGYLDGRLLSQLVTSPSNRNVYRLERHQSITNSQVSILIDCSGSMTDNITPVSTLVDILGRALDASGVTTEVLGYTTNSWSGGKCIQQWMSEGRPEAPGRLNEACHLIYKDAQTPWRRARSSVAALLKPDLFKEGIDGEAVEWACKRLLAGDSERKLLIVISDGCPMDTATNLANEQHYLDNHLKHVIEVMTRQNGIDIFGLGVGLDLSAFYEHSLSLDLSRNLSNQVFDDILQLLAGRHHR